LRYVHHDPMRRLVILVEDTLEDMDHEIHRRVVVVEQQNTIEVRPLRLPPCLGDDRGLRCAIALRLRSSPARREGDSGIII
jgi:hypothetical protein